MRFLVDECTGPELSRWLRQQGHDVLSVYEEIRGADDHAVLRIAFVEDRILITNDKDFGQMVVHEREPHKGVILMRLEDERTANKVKVLEQLLSRYADQLVDNLVVTTESTIRIARPGARQ